MKGKKEIYWRRLDNYAKLFPLASTKKYSSVFRFSVILKEDINEYILKEAVKMALKKFKHFKVKLKKGLFWYYFETNYKDIKIEEENDYPCKYIDLPINNDYLFKITYFKNKINIDMFHALTDGNNAMHFLKEITYNYIEIKYYSNKQNDHTVERKIKYSDEDGYLKNYNKKLKPNAHEKKAYVLSGKKLPLDIRRVTHEIFEVDEIRKVAKKENATVTQFLLANLIYAISEVGLKKSKSKRDIKICVPVNLRNYFLSNTAANFFSYINVNVKKEECINYEDVLEKVKKEFKDKLTEEEMQKTITKFMKIGNNVFLRILPLFIKKVIVQNVYREIRKYNTTTLSNIGRIGIISKYREYIDGFLFLLAPESIEKIKCTACSYENKLIFTIVSVLENKEVEKEFIKLLERKGIHAKIEGNGV
ncbi:MAG: hypothetical protein HFJ46_00095 [Clostridia bacterium]|nr:hypothetical protein [Clostridia bacterium]